MAEVDNSLTLSILQRAQADMRQNRTMLLQVVELLRRHDRRFDEIESRISDARADLELMLKAEFLGRPKPKSTSGSRSSRDRLSSDRPQF